MVKFLVFLLLGSLLIIFGCQNNAGNLKTNQSPPVVVGVDDVVADPFAYVGQIAIEGVVSFVYPSDSAFVIIDVKEYELCGVVTCAINEIQIKLLPDSFLGELPEVKDVVLTYGEIINGDNEFIFEVLKVKKDGKTILQKLE